MLNRIRRDAAEAGKATAFCLNLLAALAVAGSVYAADQGVVAGDPPNTPAILGALALAFPANKFSRSGPFCRPQPVRIFRISGGDWGEVTLFDRAACFVRGAQDGIPYEVWLRQSPAGAWAIICQSRYTDVPSYDQVLKVCNTMPKAVYDAYFGS